mgnify:CR=1 FL=1
MSVPRVCTLTATPQAAGEASRWLHDAAATLGIASAWLDTLDLCVVELVANIVDHAYQGEPGPIVLSLDAGAEHASLHLRDFAAPFDPLNVPPPKAAEQLADAQIGGYGVFLVRKLADHVAYHHDGECNCLTVTMGRQPQRRGPDRRQWSASAALPSGIEERRTGLDRRAFGLISKAALFRGVAYDGLEYVLQNCPLVDVEPGHVVIAAGAPARNVWLVLSGRLHIHVDGPDQEHSFEIVDNECFGEISVADGKAATAWVVAATPCRLLRIDGQLFVDRLLTIPQVGRNLILILTERTRRHSALTIERVRLETELKGLQRELEFAQRIQSSMLPPSPLFAEEARLDCAGFMRPARQVGGDFYEALTLDQDRYLVAIGDVCNKGMPAALFMAQTLSMLRSFAMRAFNDDKASLAELVMLGNDQLARLNSEQLFVSIFLGIVDLPAGQLHYLNAGHNPPWLARPGQPPCLLNAPRNPVAGMIPGLSFHSGCVDFPRGSLLLLYTDGVTEAENPEGQFFGDDALAALFAAASADGVSAPELARDITEAVDAFAGSHVQSDDITLLALRHLAC